MCKKGYMEQVETVTVDLSFLSRGKHNGLTMANYNCLRNPGSVSHCQCWDRGEECCYCDANFGRGLGKCVRE